MVYHYIEFFNNNEDHITTLGPILVVDDDRFNLEVV